MNDLQENLITFVVMMLAQNDRRCRSKGFLTVEMLNTNKFGKIIFCDWKYWESVVERINWN